MDNGLFGRGYTLRVDVYCPCNHPRSYPCRSYNQAPQHTAIGRELRTDLRHKSDKGARSGISIHHTPCRHCNRLLRTYRLCRACRATLVTKCAVSSYLAVSPLPTLQQAVCFLLRYPSHYCAWTLSSILLYGARTFLWHCCRRPSATQNEFRKILEKVVRENFKRIKLLQTNKALIL